LTKNFFREKRHSASAPRRSAMGSTPSTAHRLAPSLRCIIRLLTKNFSVKRCHLLRLVRMRQWDVHQYYPSAHSSRAACK